MTEAPNAVHVVAKKRPGSWYVVVLGDPEDKDLTRSSGTFPTPDLGSDCVCCDSADAEIIHYDPSTGPFVASPVPIPLCGACQKHVHLNEKRAVYVVAAAFIGVGLGVLGAFLNIIILGLGALVLAGAVGVLLWNRNRHRSNCQSGHCSGLEIAGAPGVCSVRTMNVRVAERLVARHQGGIIKVK